MELNMMSENPLERTLQWFTDNRPQQFYAVGLPASVSFSFCMRSQGDILQILSLEEVSQGSPLDKHEKRYYTEEMAQDTNDKKH